MDYLKLNFIKETKETELPLKLGVTVPYKGSIYQAISQDTGKQGWWWKIISGNAPQGINKVFLKYDDPIYTLPRFNPIKSINNLNTSKIERESKIPEYITDSVSAYEFAMSIPGRPEIVRDVEYLISKNPYLSALYAKNKNFTFDYALDSIKSEPHAALFYAKHILHRRWKEPEVEKRILDNPTTNNVYTHIFNLI